jgi:hypothetical protein
MSRRRDGWTGAVKVADGAEDVGRVAKRRRNPAETVTSSTEDAGYFVGHVLNRAFPVRYRLDVCGLVVFFASAYLHDLILSL